MNLFLKTALYFFLITATAFPGPLSAYSLDPDSTVSSSDRSSGTSPDLYDRNSSYLWPTNASPYASASFGETRSAHFHAALDIKTWGRKGYKVFATRDGVLARVGIYAKGYGNVLYLRHDDGTYSIYAHLQDFIPPIRTYVDSLRLSDYRFQLNHFVQQKTFRFEKGDLIGYSGASGVGPPHLHFELRTARNHPFNPLLTNLSVPDNRSPRFDGIAVEPLSADALVEGEKSIYTRKPQFRSGSYHFGTIDIQGTVGLAVDVFDLANRVGNAYAVYELSLLHNGETLFHSRVDSFSYEQTRQLFLDRVYPILQTNRLGYQRMYISDGNTLPFYQDSVDNNGKIRLSEGTHRFEIIASDYYGNRRKAVVTLNVNSPNFQSIYTGQPLTSNPSVEPRTSLSYRILDQWIWNKNWIAFPPDFTLFSYYTTSSDMFSRMYHDHSILRAGSYPVIPLQHTKNILEIPSSKGVTLHRVRPGQHQRIRAIKSNVYADFKPNSLYDTLSVALISDATNDSALTTLHVFPENQPVRSSYRIHYGELSAAPSISSDKWAFYRKSKREKELEHIPTIHVGSGKFEADVEHFGTFQLLSDTTPPTISDPRLYRNEGNQWVASVKVSDNLSGIAFTDARMFINNQEGIPRYDPERKRLIYYHPDFKPEPENKLRVIVPDKIGNRQEAEYRLRR